MDELVERVRQLGTGVAPAAAGGQTDNGAEPAASGGPAPLLPVSSMAAPPPTLEPAVAPPPLQPSPGSPEGSLPQELPGSPTEHLLSCQLRLQQRLLTAPGLGCGSPGREAATQRPATGSPGKVKPLMQVGLAARAELIKVHVGRHSGDSLAAVVQIVSAFGITFLPL